MKNNRMKIKKRNYIIVFSFLVLLFSSFMFFRSDNQKYIGKTNSVDFIEVAAGKKKTVNLVKMDSNGLNGIILCNKYEAFEHSNDGNYVTTEPYDNNHTGNDKTGIGVYVVPINTVSCYEYIKYDSTSLPESNLSKDEVKNAYCIDPVKDHAVTNSDSGYYEIDKSVNFINQMLNGLVQATKTSDQMGAVSGVRTIALPDNGVQSIGECPVDGNPKGLNQDMTCRFWRGLDPGDKTNYGWDSSGEYSLKAFNSNIASSVSSIRNAAKNTGNSALINYNDLANISFEQSYEITDFNNCEGKSCSFKVTFTKVVPAGYDKKQMKLNLASDFTKYDCTVNGVDLVCSFEFPSSKLSTIKESVIVAGVEFNPTGDTGVALLLKPENSNVSKQRLIIVDKTPKWLQFAFKIEIEEEPCDEFYKLIEEKGADAAWSIIKSKYKKQEIEECCLYPDAKNPGKYAINQTEKGQKFFNKYCSCDFLLKTLDENFTGLVDEDDAWKRYKALKNSDNEKFTYMKENLLAGKACCSTDYIPPSNYAAGYIKNFADSKFYNAFCNNSCTMILNNNTKTIKEKKTADELAEFLKTKMQKGSNSDLNDADSLNLEDSLCCDEIKVKMNQSGAPEVYKLYYEEKCQSCDELIKKVKNGESLNVDDKKYFKEHSCCDQLTPNEIKNIASLKDVCPQPDKCEISGFKVACDPDNNNPVDNYLVYEAYSGSPDEPYNSAYDNFGGCVVDVSFNREKYLENNGKLDYEETEGQKRFTESDLKGNSYYLNDDKYTSNRYCRISCSERWEFQFSAFQNFIGKDKVQNTLTGTYFDLTKDLYLKGQTTCVTTYIDYELYVEQMKAYSKAERAAYNVYQEASVLLAEAKKDIPTKDDYWGGDENGHIFITHNQNGSHGFDDKWCVRYKTTSTTGSPYCDKTIEITGSDGKKTSKCVHYSKTFTFECEESGYDDCDVGFIRNTKPSSVKVYDLKTGAAITQLTSGGASATQASTKNPQKTVSCGSTPEACPESTSRERELDDYNVESAYETCELRKFMVNKKNIEDGKKNEKASPGDYICGKSGCSGTMSYEGFDANGQPATITQDFYGLSPDQVESALESFSNSDAVQGLMETTVTKKLGDAKTKYLIEKLKYSTSLSGPDEGGGKTNYTLIYPYKFTLGQEYEFVIEGEGAGSIFVTNGDNPYKSSLSMSINDYSSVCCDSAYADKVANNTSLKNACNSFKTYGEGCDSNKNNEYNPYGKLNNLGGKTGDNKNSDDAKIAYIVDPNYKWESSSSTINSRAVLLGSGAIYEKAMETAEGRVNGSYKGEINGMAKDMTNCQYYYIANDTKKQKYPDMSGRDTKVSNYNYSDPSNFGLGTYENDFTEKKEYYIKQINNESRELLERTIDSAIPVIYYPTNTSGNNNGLGILLNKHDATNNAIISSFDPRVSVYYMPKATYGYDETDYMNMLGINNFIVTDNKKNERISGINNDSGDKFNVSGGTDSADGQSRAIYINKTRTQAYAASTPWGNDSTNGNQYSGNLVFDSDTGGKITANTQALYLCGIGNTKDPLLKEAYQKAGTESLVDTNSPILEGCYRLDLYYYPVNYIKESITNSSFYENYGNFYFSLDKENGKIKSTWAVDKDDAKSKIGLASPLATDRVGVFPVQFSTPVGPHSYRYWFEDVGTYFNENGRLGRIMSASHNEDAIVEYSGHYCLYEVFEQYCACCGKEIEVRIYEHEGYDDPQGKIKAEIEKKIEELGDKYATQTRIVGAVNDSTSGGTLGYYSSTVSLNDLKTLSGIWSDSTNLLYDGEMYKTENDKGGELAKQISSYGENAYAGGSSKAEYSYTLTPAVLSKIRESNGNSDRNVRNNYVYGLGSLVTVGDEYEYNQKDKADEEPTFVHYKSTYLDNFENEGMFKGLPDNICEASASDIEQVVKKQGIYANCKFVDYITHATSPDGIDRTFRLPFK